MLSQECVRELQWAWLPNITDSGLDRLIELLEKGSPLLVHGCFAMRANRLPGDPCRLASSSDGEHHCRGRR